MLIRIANCKILYTMHRAEKESYFHYSLLTGTMLIASISHNARMCILNYENQQSCMRKTV